MTRNAQLEFDLTVDFKSILPVYLEGNVPAGRELENMKVYLNGKEITDTLSKEQLEEIESQILDNE